MADPNPRIPAVGGPMSLWILCTHNTYTAPPLRVSNAARSHIMHDDSPANCNGGMCRRYTKAAFHRTMHHAKEVVLYLVQTITSSLSELFKS